MANSSVSCSVIALVWFPFGFLFATITIGCHASQHYISPFVTHAESGKHTLIDICSQHCVSTGQVHNTFIHEVLLVQLFLCVRLFIAYEPLRGLSWTTTCCTALSNLFWTCFVSLIDTLYISCLLSIATITLILLLFPVYCYCLSTLFDILRPRSGITFILHIIYV